MTPRTPCFRHLARLGAQVALATLGLGGATGALAADVGVSISISQPGVYGRVDIGRFPQPTVVLQQPVLVAPRPVPVQPVYLWVPPGHRQHWRQHCARYNACGAPVYFVRDDWYRQRVMGDGGHGGRAGFEDHGERRHGHDGRWQGREHGPERGQGHGHRD